MTRDRVARMDWLRGAASVLIVDLHASAVLESHDIVPSRIAVPVDDGLSSFRVPALIVLSGLLLQHALGKGALRYLEGKVGAILWP